MKSLLEQQRKAWIFKRTGQLLAYVGCGAAFISFLLVCLDIYQQEFKIPNYKLCAMFLSISIGLLALVPLAYFAEWRRAIESAIKNRAYKGYKGPFFLLLRSYENTYAYSEVVCERRINEAGTDMEEVTKIPGFGIQNKLAARIASATSKVAPLVAVGGADDFPHDVRVLIIYPDTNDWQKYIRVLATHAKAIFLLPESTAGVLEEMNLLRNDRLFEKVIVIMPPLAEDRFRSDEYTTYHGQDIQTWQNLREELRSHGYNLPQASRSGMMFTVNADFSVKKSIPLNYSEPGYGVEKAFELVLPTLSNRNWLPLGRLYKNIEPALPRVSFEGFWEPAVHITAVFVGVLLIIILIASKLCECF